MSRVLDWTAWRTDSRNPVGCRKSGRLLRRMLPATVFLASAHTVWSQPADGIAPLGLSPGAPAGSYAVSDLERANLFNGNLSFHLPLLKIGGRGEAGHVVALTIEQRWGTKRKVQPSGTVVVQPRFNWWRGVRPGYGPGALRAYLTPSGELRVTFTDSDETQF